ncbi:MAG: hypothetical protein AABY14_00220, partial [Nanoarchaeota archaeon]
LGNEGGESDEIKIIKDTTSPTATNSQPANGIILPSNVDNKVKIAVDIADTGTGIDESSITFNICKLGVSDNPINFSLECKNLLGKDFDIKTNFHTEKDSGGKITKATIDYPLTHTGEIAKYQVLIGVRDKVGNLIKSMGGNLVGYYENIFTVDPSVSAPPTFSIGDIQKNVKTGEALYLKNKDTTIRIDFTGAINAVGTANMNNGKKIQIKSIALVKSDNTEIPITFNYNELPYGNNPTNNFIDVDVKLPDDLANAQTYKLKVSVSRAIQQEDSMNWGKENPYTVDLIVDTIKPVLEDITLIKLAGQSDKYTITGKYKEENLQSIGYKYKEGTGSFGGLIPLENFGEGIFSIEDIIINSINTFEFELQLKDKSDNLKTVNFKTATSDKFSITETNLGYKDTTTNQIYINKPDIMLTGTASDIK